jgi:hypothetical protein
LNKEEEIDKAIDPKLPIKSKFKKGNLKKFFSGKLLLR